jgi:hypothetical protein
LEPNFDARDLPSKGSNDKGIRLAWTGVVEWPNTDGAQALLGECTNGQICRCLGHSIGIQWREQGRFV